MHNYQDLISIFEDCFLQEYNTVLVKGDGEPIYLPADSANKHHRVIFAHGFYASALHETAHWLIAGEKRRELVDFGYWYEPDGRTADQQQLFLQAEVKPQAMEWILSKAAGFRFYVSLDNLNGQESDTEVFKARVHNQIKSYCENGLPKRAKTLREALCKFYGTDASMRIEDYAIESL